MSGNAVENELLALEKKRSEALVRRDAAALEALFTDDLVHIHSIGTVMNKTELMHYVMKVLQFLSVTRSDMVVRQYGDVVVMTGRMKNSMQRADRPDVVWADAWVTQVWVRTPSGWRQSHFHACRVAEPPKV